MKNNTKDSGLKYSWNLIAEIEAIKMTDELREQINRYIEYKKNSSGVDNLFFRSNLHYIIENISKPELLSELSKANEKHQTEKNKQVTNK